MQQEVIFNVGVSGSGKTTWTTNFIKSNPKYLRINRDDIRKTLVGSLDGYYQRKDLSTIEVLVNKIENHLGEHALNCGYSIIIDNTNLNIKYIDDKIKSLDKYNKHYSKNIPIRFKIFPEANRAVLKTRVMARDLLFEENVSYIDRQVAQLDDIIKKLNANFKELIINEEGS